MSGGCRAQGIVAALGDIKAKGVAPTLCADVAANKKLDASLVAQLQATFPRAFPSAQEDEPATVWECPAPTCLCCSHRSFIRVDSRLCIISGKDPRPDCICVYLCVSVFVGVCVRIMWRSFVVFSRNDHLECRCQSTAVTTSTMRRCSLLYNDSDASTLHRFLPMQDTRKKRVTRKRSAKGKHTSSCSLIDSVVQLFHLRVPLAQSDGVSH